MFGERRLCFLRWCFGLLSQCHSKSSTMSPTTDCDARRSPRGSTSESTRDTPGIPLTLSQTCMSLFASALGPPRKCKQAVPGPVELRRERKVAFSYLCAFDLALSPKFWFKEMDPLVQIFEVEKRQPRKEEIQKIV